MATVSDLSVERRVGAGGGSGPHAVARPRSRWKTRVLLPAAILLAVGALLVYAARDALSSSTVVRVVPVIVKQRAVSARPPGDANGSGSEPSGPQAESAVIVQAPGWVEPAPYAINVPALAEGVVKDVLVLEGQRVEAGQVVVRLVDDDARLSLKRAEAEADERAAEVARARADVATAEADAAEVRDEVERKRSLVQAGGLSEGQFARLELRLQAAQRRVEASGAMVMQAQAGARLAQVMREEAALTLSRMEIRSPASGVVMTRLVEPGARLSMLAASYGGAPQGSAGAVEVMGAVVRLYDPLMLQVRVDVPLGDAGKVGPGTQARITTEALPGKTFAGRVTRAVHEANIQRNTVQLKVAIDEPDPVLRPEMLARVRFLADARPGSDSRSAAGDGTSHAEDVRLLIPRSAVLEANDGAGRVWLADQAGGTRGPVAARRPISFVAAPEDGFVEVVEGLRPGDRVVIDPAPRLVEGARLKMIEDATGGGP